MKKLSALLCAFVLILSCCACVGIMPQQQEGFFATVDDVPPFKDDTPFVAINGNIPVFSNAEKALEPFEYYSPLDSLSRCGVTMACISESIMPTEDRGTIGQVKPSGWHTVKYDVVDGKYLYNRCHLIGYQLAGENANEQNLITGTRYMNVEGMLPFENEVADYARETGNRVLYRVTPIFDGDNLLARGVQMEAWSVEDEGEGVCFNVYVYNAQPGIEIDYKTGESRLIGQTESDTGAGQFIVNISTKKFHAPSCEKAASISEKNRKTYSGNRDSLINNGYSPCSYCNP